MLTYMTDKNIEYDKDTYKALYDFQIKELDSVRAHHSRLEDKASKYLTFTSIIIAALSLFLKQYLFDSEQIGLLYILVVSLMLITFVSLCCIARFLFHVVEVGSVGKLDTGEEMIKLFATKDLPVVQYNLAKDLSKVIKMYEENNSNKIDYLKRAFGEIKFCGLLLVLTVILIIIDSIGNHKFMINANKPIPPDVNTPPIVVIEKGADKGKS